MSQTNSSITSVGRTTLTTCTEYIYYSPVRQRPAHPSRALCEQLNVCSVGGCPVIMTNPHGHHWTFLSFYHNQSICYQVTENYQKRKLAPYMSRLKVQGLPSVSRPSTTIRTKNLVQWLKNCDRDGFSRHITPPTDQDLSFATSSFGLGDARTRIGLWGIFVRFVVPHNFTALEGISPVDKIPPRIHLQSHRTRWDSETVRP